MLDLKRLLQLVVLITISTSLILMNAHAGSGPINQSTFGEDLDSYIPNCMNRYHIPGSVFVFVKHGKIFFKKGYGYADLESQTPVDPDKTVFRVGSNSKLFIATAVMQLVEQGKLNLDEDINEYLKTFNVPNKPNKPITLKNLLTHTAGFDEVNLNMSTLRKKDRLELGEYLKKAMPDIVMESGKVTSYSSYGMNLAAFIVESVSGMPFHRYVDENILKPLKMKNSGFMPEPSLMKNKATPYIYRNKRYESLPHDYMHGYPAASFMTTGSDLARFIIAHLQKVEPDGISILNKSGAEFMHQKQFSNHPALPGMGLGFIEDRIKGYRIIRHSGWVAGFKTMSVLIPDLQVGMFISYNIEYPIPRGRNNALSLEIIRHILERYYPTVSRSAQDEGILSGFPESIEGSYRKNRLARKMFTKAGSFGNDLNVRIIDSQSILVGKDKFNQKGPLLFEKNGAEERIGFRTDENGIITHLFKGSAAVAWDRLTFFETSFFHLLLLGVSGVIFLLAMFLTPFMVYRYRIKAGVVHKVTSIAWWLSGTVGFINIASTALLVWTLLSSTYISTYWTLPTGLKQILILPIIASILGLILTGVTIYLWVKKHGSIYDRIFFSVVIVGCLLFTFFLDYWNLLGFHTGSF